MVHCGNEGKVKVLIGIRLLEVGAFESDKAAYILFIFSRPVLVLFDLCFVYILKIYFGDYVDGLPIIADVHYVPQFSNPLD